MTVNAEDLEAEAAALAWDAPLMTKDRCDRCGAAAYVRTHHEFGELLWCSHHWAEHAFVVRETAVHVHSELSRLER